MVASSLENLKGNINMKAFISVLLCGCSMVIFAEALRADTCDTQCNAKFGEFIGKSLRTKAYSNCNDACVSNEGNLIFYDTGKREMYTGMKWQCVEYARRWMIENKGMTFGDVVYAYDIWDLPTVENIHSHTHTSWQRFTNKDSKKRPQIGDLLIYNNSIAVTGHVAVVVGAGKDYVLIAEQNYFNRHWVKNDYARQLLMKVDNQGNYQVVDDGVMGWMRY